MKQIFYDEVVAKKTYTSLRKDSNENLFVVFDHLLENAAAWNLPVTSLISIYLLPIVINGKVNLHELQTPNNHQVHKNMVALTYNLDLYEASLINKENLLSLNKLIWQAYIDQPNFETILLLICLHDAYLTCNHEENIQLARYSLYVFIPFLEMFGLWDLRIKWLNHAYEILISKDKETKTKYLEVKPIIDLLLINQDKLSEFETLKNLLNKNLKKQEIEIARIEIRKHSLGGLLHRYITGYAIEEYLNHIWIKIITTSEDDCYKILGAVHALGPLSISKEIERFADFLNYPQENGYRCLETMVNVRLPIQRKPDGAEKYIQKLVRVRILSKQMDDVNSDGVIETHFINKQSYQNHAGYFNTWWNSDNHDHLISQINRRNNLKYKNLTEFLQANPPGTTSKTIYVFTPKGDLVILPENSSPLDFAIRIHKEIGKYYKESFVNGKFASPDHQLKNGDIVNIISDISHSRPELAWLNYVKTKQARTNLKNMLFPEHSVNSSEGYNILQKKLLEIKDFYKNKKQYDVDFDLKRLEYFLKHYAKSNDFFNLDSFYQAINGEYLIIAGKKNILIEKIIFAFVFENLFYGLNFSNNAIQKSLTPHRVKFCRKCLPVPEEAIEAYEYRTGTINRYIIHASACDSKPTSLKKIRVNWKQVNMEPLFYRFDIEAQDRFGLIEDLLKPIYAQPNEFYLRQITAYVNHKNISNISMVISTPDTQYFERLKTETEKKPGVRQINTNQISPLVALKWSSKDQFPEDNPNPFFESAVSEEKRFYDRAEPIKEILDWLHADTSQYITFLIGQRRIGKTSLGLFLTNHKITRSANALAFYIDLHHVIPDHFDDFVKAVVKKMNDDSKSIPLEQLPNESIIDWFNRSMIRLKNTKNKAFIFIFFDELDSLVEMVHKNKIALEFIENFLNLFNTPTFRCILSLSETARPETQALIPVQRLLQKANPIRIEPFDKNYTHLLIRESFEEAGFIFPDSHKKNKLDKPCALITKIINQSSGIPYFTKAICFEVIKILNKQNRKNITNKDVNTAINRVLNDGDNRFFHFTEKTNTLQKILLHCIATIPNCTTASIESFLDDNDQHTDEEKVLDALRTLEEQKIIDIKYKDSTDILQAATFKIQVELFANWIEKGFLLRKINL